MRFGTVALVGRTNVGKSTLLNATLGVPLAIVSHRPQTTRDALLGVLTRDDSQIALLDTPGLRRPHSELARRLNTAALQAARSADLLLFMTDRHEAEAESTGGEPAAPVVDPDDRQVLDLTLTAAPCVALINKVDRLSNKSQLLPMIEALTRYHDFAAIMPVSVTRPDDVERVLAEIQKLLPEGPPGYETDTLTDRPSSFFVREYVREQVLLSAKGEVPHAVAVAVESIHTSRDLTVIKATLHVQKPGQRKILVGRNGTQIRAIGIGARQRIEALLGCRVHLELFVRVSPRWKDLPRQLAELGYPAPESVGEHPVTPAWPAAPPRRRKRS